MEDGEKRPSPAELKYLSLAYNRFYDIFDEVLADSFWEKDKYYRFCKTRDAFSVYTELLNYEPIQWVIKHLRTQRPPMEAEAGSELFKLVRNVLAHFSIVESWEDVYIDKDWSAPYTTDQRERNSSTQIDELLGEESSLEPGLSSLPVVELGLAPPGTFLPGYYQTRGSLQMLWRGVKQREGK